MIFDPIILLGIKISLTAILVDTMIGWVLAFASGTFDITKMPRFLATNIFPYIGALLIVAFASNYDATWKPLFEICCGLITVKFGYEAVKEKIVGYFNNK